MTNKTVRPIMTVEARDVLDKIHENVNGETRSESIEWFWIRYINLLSQRDSMVGDKRYLAESVSYHRNEKVIALKETSKYKLISIITSTSFLALLAVTIFNAS